MKTKIDENCLRQYEILARCLNGEKFSVFDLADYYGVEEITINRDLNELRSSGIPINSRKKTIDVEAEAMDKGLLVQIVSEYCTKKLGTDIFFRKIKVLLNSSGIKCSSYLTLLAKSIKEKKEVEIKYQKLGDNKINVYTLQPLEILNNEYNWVLKAHHSGIEKLFFINRIKELRLTDKKFLRKRLESETGKEFIKLRFHPDVEQQVIGKIWFDKFNFEKDSEGYIILTTKQEITNSLTSWCISWWDKIEVLEPESLRDHINNMIKAFQSKNN